MWTARSGYGSGLRLGLVVWMVVSGCRGATPAEPAGPPQAPPVEVSVPKLVPPIVGGSDAVRQQVVRFFAPIIYQDIEDHSAQDLFTRITFDGNWRGNDNWEHTFLHPKPGIVYTSLIEDANRYFLHYGLFWPRDWCSFTCTFAQDMHENDMEGLSLVVDKRFVTTGWPFGQIISMDTRSHNGLSRYRNCQLDGGFPSYVTLRTGSTPACVPFTSAHGGAISPAAPRRAAVFVNAQTHAVRGYAAGDYPFAGGDGVIYYPTSGPAQVPSSTSTITQAGYNLQWIDSTEVNNWSLWSQRRNATQTLNDMLFEHDGNLVGPHDVYYLKHFACDGDCPLIGTRAKAPWGISSGNGRVGDWHNHPAFAWSLIYGPTGGWSPWYEYSCLTLACRTQNTYRHNVYWSDAPWLAGGGTGSGGGSSCGSCPKTSAGLARQGRGAEYRWDFETEKGVTVSGDGYATLRREPDDEWGNADGMVTFLRVQGRGQISLTFDGQFDPARLDQAIVRARRARGKAVSLAASWEIEAEPTTPGQRFDMARYSVSPRSWEVMALDLGGALAWKRQQKINRFTLTFVLDKGSGDTIDFDFAILAP
jgi:hypothetical protein